MRRADLARAVGVSPQAVAKWEDGSTHYIRRDHMTKMAQVLKHPEAWFYGDEKKANNKKEPDMEVSETAIQLAYLFDALPAEQQGDLLRSAAQLTEELRQSARTVDRDAQQAAHLQRLRKLITDS